MCTKPASSPSTLAASVGLGSHSSAGGGEPGRISTKFGAFVYGVHSFDCAVFGLPTSEAACMDPQQRLCTMCVFVSVYTSVSIYNYRWPGVHVNVCTLTALALPKLGFLRTKFN